MSHQDGRFGFTIIWFDLFLLLLFEQNTRLNFIDYDIIVRQIWSFILKSIYNKRGNNPYNL